MSDAGPDTTSAPARRRLLLIEGCVQPSIMPGIDDAAERVFRRAGFAVIRLRASCCGAVRAHLGDSDGGLEHMRANVRAWSPLLASGGVDAVVSSASACALTIKDYGYALRKDPDHRDAAAKLSERARDLSEYLPDLVSALRGKLRPAGERLAYHPPCTLQHGQKLRGGVEAGLRELGFDIQTAPREAHLCCGSAGTYALLQPSIAEALRDRKLQALAELGASSFVSSNMGCIRHLQSGSRTPVRHWVEILDEALPPV